MEDIISKYKKQKKIKTFGVIALSLMLAISLNIYLSTSDMGKALKSSVMDSGTQAESKSDLYLETNKNIISLKSSKQIKQVKNISFSFLYNPENIELKDKILGKFKGEIIEIAKSDGQYTVTINFQTPADIESKNDILSLVFDKKTSKKENINLAQANFVDNNNNSFTMSTSGVEY